MWHRTFGNLSLTIEGNHGVRKNRFFALFTILIKFVNLSLFFRKRLLAAQADSSDAETMKVFEMDSISPTSAS